MADAPKPRSKGSLVLPVCALHFVVAFWRMRFMAISSSAVRLASAMKRGCWDLRVFEIANIQHQLLEKYSDCHVDAYLGVIACEAPPAMRIYAR